MPKTREVERGDSTFSAFRRSAYALPDETGDGKTMLKPELYELIAHGENSGVEFKRDDVRPEQLAKEVVALANFDGSPQTGYSPGDSLSTRASV